MDSLVIANLFLLLFLGLADNQMIAALLPSLVKSFGISVSTAGLLVVVYSLAAAVAAFFSGTALRPLRPAAISAGWGGVLCRGFVGGVAEPHPE